MSLQTFFDMAATPYARAGKTIRLDIIADGAVDPGTLMIRRRPEWLHALSAFIENATDFARSQVIVRVEVQKAFIRLSVEDDGPGFAPDILSRLGEPYVSSRSHHAENAQSLDRQGHTGMGLGLFIAKTLCEHTGAVVTFGNLERGGAYVRALWRRDRVDILLADAVMGE